MKYERIQEVLRYITPGLYLLALVLAINFDVIKGNQETRDTISKFSAIIVVLIPFVGFVTGYFIECLMSLLERLLYWIGVPRPSLVVLRGKSRFYVLGESVRKEIIKNVKNLDNKSANSCRQEAKQTVADNEFVNKFYYQSIMARHILGAQIVATVYYLAFAGGWSWCHLIWALLIIALLVYFWYHQNCVYMKYLFSEYVGRLNEARYA